MKTEILNILAVMMNCNNAELVAKAEIELQELKEKADNMDEKETPVKPKLDEYLDSCCSKCGGRV